jgi:hypothetical protein
VIETAGSWVTYDITLVSNKAVTEEVSLSLTTWEVTGDQFLFSPFEEGWVSLSATHITIPSGSTQTLQFGVRVPESEGERRFEINFTSDMPNSPIRFTKSIPSYLVIAGTDFVQCRIVSFDIFHEGDSLQANCVIENEGNIHIRPRIDIQFLGDPNWIRVQDDVPVYPFSRRRLGNIIPWPATGKEGVIVNVRVQYFDTQSRQYTILDQAVVR